jgi:Fe-S cluster assembly ATP-binding protein
VANLNTFIQERLTGMKIVQLFNREKIEFEKFKEINNKHNKAWLKNILYNSIFFPIADIVSSITLGLVVYFGALFIINGDTNTSVGQLISFNMYIAMLYTPLRQIADKFNVMQMGIVAADRVFEILESNSEVQDNGTISAKKFKGNIKFENVRFSYIKEEEILKGINLEVKAGEVHAIMGPNGAGKSTLSSIIAGNENYNVTAGEIILEGEDISELAPEERAHKGVFLSFQYPVEIPGVSVTNFMKTAINESRKARGQEDMPANEMLKLIREKSELLEIDRKFLSRSLNEGFSGGEKKRNEIFQMAMLEPKLAILDETDSGLDIDALRIVANGVNKLKNETNAVLVITHYQRLLDYIVPDFVHVLMDGKIVKSGDASLALELEEKGYDWIKNELV